MNTFGTNLTRLRTQRGISQYKLADALGVRQSAIGNLEAGRSNPSWRLAQRIADYFDVTLAEMNAPVAQAEPEPELCH